MLAVFCKGKIGSSSIILTNTSLFWKVATAETYYFKLVWI